MLTVISTSEELLAISSIDVPSSLIVTLAPSASRIISASESNVILPDDKESISAILGVVKVLLVNVSVDTKDTKVESAPAGNNILFVTPAE